jgi:hypothetical protein
MYFFIQLESIYVEEAIASRLLTIVHVLYLLGTGIRSIPAQKLAFSHKNFLSLRKIAISNFIYLFIFYKFMT